MKQLIIKPEFRGLTITKRIFILNANVTLDTSKFLSQEELKAYYRLDEFKDVIIEETVLPTYEIIPDEIGGITNIIFTETDNKEEQFTTFESESNTKKEPIKYNGIEQQTKKRDRKTKK